MKNTWAMLTLVVLSGALALGVRGALLASLRPLLSGTLRVQGAVEFFARAFSMILLFAALGPALSTTIELKPESHLMESVWAVAAGLGGAIESLLVSLGAYLLVITVLLAALKPKNEQ